MDEAIFMISPIDSPFLNGIGTDGRQLLGSSSVDQTSWKWMDEQLLLPRANISAGNAALGVAHTTMTVAVADSYKFQENDLVTTLDRSHAATGTVLLVSDVNNTTGVLTVGEWVNHAGQLATAHGANADTIICVGSALIEGSDAGPSRSADRTIRSGNTQIFGPTKVDMTRTEQQISRYGVSDEFAKQLYGRTVENVIMREQAYLYGQKRDDTSTKRRSSGSLSSFITSNVSTDNALTIGSLETLMQTTYNIGGVPDLLMANPTSLTDLNNISDSSRVRTVIDDPRRGRVPVTSVFHEFGETQIVRNRWVDKGDAFIIVKDNVQRRVIQPLIVEALAKTGDSDSVHIVCEEGLQVKAEQYMAKWNTLTDYTGAGAGYGSV
tara:strand:- start:11581 stop:12720 length:1140 start_codon:yes stop_codon:yes gene_type:complete